ncbi:tetratricopeptide repeat protein [Uliginosibacterium aquaticum]|uniref:Glycosyltransferase family protein n=1 Tax=Uliginosibacterium aquaticum TaxID=2731212 RepID=A0ABX2ICR0_9RHOO|nr:tetratricopeptide repeat-containing glycosyltransferase family protein [Uliginosibacterium aquaticum]NSL54335.1 glycosyltransferase family protein [Uliginosibacterium aquaticum]
MNHASGALLAPPADALFNEGVALMMAGTRTQAEGCFRRAISLQPEFSQAWVNLGLLLDQGGEATEAEHCYRHALELGERSPQLFLNYGALLAARQDFEAAIATYREGISSDPHTPALWSNLGALLVSLRRDAEAEACLYTALEHSPDYPSARYNLGYLLLRQGNFDEGLSYFEARDWYAGLENVLGDTLGIRRWQGEALTGKSILITCEAGHGDMIQFGRYARLLKARGAARVELLCHPGLQRLFTTLVGIDQVLPLDHPVHLANWDFWCPPLSLPRYCGTNARSIPAVTPYLHPDAADKARWQRVLPSGGLRIGLVWRGNPKFENDRERSLPHLLHLAPLWSVPGVSFVSLQKGTGEDEAHTVQAACPITPLGPQLRDFADTAAVIAGLDLVISVDTAVAHLAGALGKPCWVMLPHFNTDWRWQLERDDSPWYPGMRLFRQPSHGDWRSVVDALVVALQALPQRPSR